MVSWAGFSRMRSSNHSKATVYQVANYGRKSFGGNSIWIGDAKTKSRVLNECYNVIVFQSTAKKVISEMKECLPSQENFPSEIYLRATSDTPFASTR